MNTSIRLKNFTEGNTPHYIPRFTWERKLNSINVSKRKTGG